MDLALNDLKALGNEGRWIDINGPTGLPTDIRMKVAGFKSDRVMAAVAEHEKRVAAAIEAKKVDEATFSALNLQRDQEVTASTILDWSGMRMGAEDFPCTPENIRKLAANPGYDWLMVQPIQASRDAGVFTTP